ncbi:hypothetical protein D3C86_2147690 [compost metagenome]
MGSRPALLMKLDMAMLPSGWGCVLPGTMADTAPSVLILMLVALGGTVMPLATGRPLELTSRPCESTWNEPSRV